MAKKEQEHRHGWQSKYLTSHNFTYRIGQLFGFIYNIALLYVVYDLITSGEKDLGLKIFAINAALMIFLILITTIERRIFSRRPSMRPRNNNANRNNKRAPNKSREPKAREPQNRK
jgi:hypothetical protein